MPDSKVYLEYRERLSFFLDQVVDKKVKKILVFGDKIQKLEEKWSIEDKTVVNLKSIKKDYFELSKYNPKFDLELEQNSFDLLVSYHGLEKAVDPQRLLLELRKYLTNEGNLISITYNAGHISTFVNINSSRYKTEEGALKEGNIRFFVYSDLKELMKQTGFEILQEEVYGFDEMPEKTNKFLQMTGNPYLKALSFIFKAKKITTFPFIEGSYP